MSRDTKLYEIPELLKIIPCSRAHIYNMCKRGDIPTVNIGRRRFIPSWAVDKLLLEPDDGFCK